MFLHVACFLQSITLEGVGCLGNILMASDLVQRQYAVAITDYAAYLGEFMLIVGSKYYFLHGFRGHYILI